MLIIITCIIICMYNAMHGRAGGRGEKEGQDHSTSHIYTMHKLLTCLPSPSPSRIDANVSETQSNVEAAHTELLKYFKSVTSNRWLMIKIFMVVLIFSIIFIVFLT